MVYRRPCSGVAFEMSSQIAGSPMQIIADTIQITDPRVAKALNEMDRLPIQDMTKRRDKAGADTIDTLQAIANHLPGIPMRENLPALIFYLMRLLFRRRIYKFMASISDALKPQQRGIETSDFGTPWRPIPGSEGERNKGYDRTGMLSNSQYMDLSFL